jgi:hypothetical protein
MDSNHLDKNSNLLAAVFKQKSFSLCRECYTYLHLEAFCIRNKIDRTSWKSVYLGLLTLKTFGASSLPTLSPMPLPESVILSENNKTEYSPFYTLDQKRPIETNEMDIYEHECLLIGLTIIKVDDATFEVYDRANNWLGDITQLADSFWDERLEEYRTLHKAALAISRSHAAAWFN